MTSQKQENSSTLFNCQSIRIETETKESWTRMDPMIGAKVPLVIRGQSIQKTKTDIKYKC